MGAHLDSSPSQKIIFLNNHKYMIASIPTIMGLLRLNLGVGQISLLQLRQCNTNRLHKWGHHQFLHLQPTHFQPTKLNSWLLTWALNYSSHILPHPLPIQVTTCPQPHIAWVIYFPLLLSQILTLHVMFGWLSMEPHTMFVVIFACSLNVHLTIMLIPLCLTET